MVTPKALPALETLDDTFRLLPGGVLLRRSTGKPTGVEKHFGKNGRLARLNVDVRRQCYAYHRVVWKMHHRSEPPALVDHIDRDPTNNDPGNLRGATCRENSANTARFSNGVQKTPGGKFRPRVTINGTRQSLGLYDTEEEAIAVRDIILAAFPT
jgi:hypothetical protein